LWTLLCTFLVETAKTKTNSNNIENFINNFFRFIITFSLGFGYLNQKSPKKARN
jgi:hypothetical protein